MTPFPVAPSGGVTVDGMVASQLLVSTASDAALAQGAVRGLAASYRVPANGYAADLLTDLRLTNTGTALPAVDVTALRFWAD